MCESLSNKLSLRTQKLSISSIIYPVPLKSQKNLEFSDNSGSKSIVELNCHSKTENSSEKM